ncbi:MAG: CotH kinase family protein, partial [Candidatus Hinthialibacter sp.]
MKQLVDQVSYSDEMGWPPEADGLGPSIERIHHAMTSDHPFSWEKGPNGGTPGRVNEAAVPDPLPVVTSIHQSPASPASSQDVQFTCQVYHSRPIVQSVLFYKLERESTFSALEIYDDGLHQDSVMGDRVFGGAVPAKPNNSVVEFYIQAEDDQGVQGYFPREGKNRPAIYRVDDDQYATMLPLYRIVMRDKDETTLRTRSATSNDELDASFVYGDQIYYNTGVRFRGKGSRGREPKSYRVNFSLTQYFGKIRKLNLNATDPHRQYVGLECFHILGLPAPEQQFVSLLFNDAFVPNYIQVERTGKDMMGRVFGDDSGNLYRGVEQANLDYRGEDPNSYRSNYEKVTNELEDDYSDIITLCSAFSATNDDEFTEALDKTINLRQWIRWFALKKILNDMEGGISKERGDDYFMYNNPLDDRFYILPWDLDSVIVKPFRPIHQYETPSVYRLVTHPETAPLYYEELADILDHKITQSVMDAVIDQTHRVTSESVRNEMKQVSRELREFIQSSIPRELTVEVSRETGASIIPDGDVWKFFRGIQNPPPDWNQVEFDDSSWEEGPSGFGYGDNDDRTVLNDMRYLYTTVFIRKVFQIENPDDYTKLLMHMIYDDGFVAYLNSVEIARSYFSATPSYRSTANGNHEIGAAELFTVENPSDLLQPGENVLALVGLNTSLTSSDFSLAVQLDGMMKTENSIELKGRANAIETRRVQVNGMPAAFIPWQAAWSYPTVLQPGRHTFLIEAFDAQERIIDATHIVVTQDGDPSQDGLEIQGDEIWTSDANPILVDSNIIIPAGCSLTIESGVDLQMAPAASIIVYGVLNVFGREESPVLIHSQNPDQPWGVIAVQDAAETTRIHYVEITQSAPVKYLGASYPAAVNIHKSTVEILGCTFFDMAGDEDIGAGVEARDSYLTIQGNHFRDMGEMLHCTSCQCLVENNVFENVLGYSDAIDFDEERGSASIIRGNMILGSEDDGIDLGNASPIMERNWIENCADKGISLEGNSAPEVINSVIVQCDMGVAVKDRCHAFLVHNTIVSCQTGISIYEKNANRGGGEAEIINCIVWDAAQSLELDDKSSATVSHSNLMHLPEAFLQSNLSVNPLFQDVSQRQLDLQADSPL